MRRARPTFIVACAAGLLALTGLVGAPATAATAKTTVTAQIVAADGSPIRGVSIYAYEIGGKKRSSYVGTSGVEGRVVAKTSSILAAGSFRLAYLDDAEQFVPLVVNKRLAAGDNDQGTVTLDFGAVVTGTVTSPAGAKVDSAYVVAVQAGEWTPPPLYFRSDAYTQPDGTYRLTGLAPGTYVVRAGYGAVESNPASAQLTVEAATSRQPAAQGPADVAKVRVPADVELEGSATSKNSVVLKATVTTDKGVIYPAGTAAIYDNGKRITAVTTLAKHPGLGHDKKFTIKNLKKGKHSFRVKYYGSSEALPGWSYNSLTFTAK